VVRAAVAEAAAERGASSVWLTAVEVRRPHARHASWGAPAAARPMR